MFDQNWLKRYMLSNQPGKGPPGSADLAGGPGGFASAPPGPALPRNPPTPGRAASAAAFALSEEPSPPPTGPSESARLKERTGLNVPTQVPRLGLGSGPGAAATASARGGLEELRLGSGFPPQLPPTGSNVPTSLASPPWGTLPPQSSLQQRPFASLPSSARPPDAVPPGAAAASLQPATASQAARPGDPVTQQPGAYTGAVGSSQSPPMAGGGFFGVPGPFGYAPFDNSTNMPGNLFNFGNEGGVKHYVVMCKDDVEVRASPTYADDTRIGHFLHPGQVVVVDDRRMITGAWFLHLADGRGWVFETKERLLVMTEAHEFERGLWHYAVACDDDVETRITPTYSDDARTGLVLGSGDCIAVDERCCVAGARFLKLADGRGWVFETKDRLLVMSEVRAKAQEARDFARGLWHYTVVCDDDVEIRAAPTYSDEARTGLTIHPGDCVAVDERCRVGAIWFLRLADGRGWVFESKDSRRVMMQLH
mmetsp:Transcript_32840/g.83098  ORF Transcript_32840/g.83098 Transcript_32840/m.83098 type:complete len:481 (-) Transcript_32840:50-1492(-)